MKKKYVIGIIVIVVVIAAYAWYAIYNSELGWGVAVHDPRIQDVTDILAVQGTYADYAFASTTASYDPQNIFYKNLFPGTEVQTATVVATSTDSVRVYVAGIDNQITMPFGWYNLEGTNKTDNSKQTIFFSPDKTISIVFKHTDPSTIISSDAQILSTIDSFYAGVGDTKGTIQIQRVPGGVAYILKGYSSAATQTSGDLFDVDLESASHPGTVIQFSYLAPSSTFDTYKGLMGLIYRDLPADFKK